MESTIGDSPRGIANSTKACFSLFFHDCEFLNFLKSEFITLSNILFKNYFASNDLADMRNVFFPALQKI